MFNEHEHCSTPYSTYVSSVSNTFLVHLELEHVSQNKETEDDKDELRRVLHLSCLDEDGLSLKRESTWRRERLVEEPNSCLSQTRVFTSYFILSWLLITAVVYSLATTPTYYGIRVQDSPSRSNASTLLKHTTVVQPIYDSTLSRG